MTYLALPIAISLPSLSGWMLVRALEGSNALLSRWERIAIGFILGVTLTMFVTFLLHIAGLILLNHLGFLMSQAAVIVPVFLIYFLRRRSHHSQVPNITLNTTLLTQSQKIAAAIAGLWIIIKITTGAVILTTTPSYQDDVFSNWNMRGKLFYQTQELSLDTDVGVNSYPPAIPMFKAMIATLYGNWNDGVVNVIHILWYVSILVLVFALVRRVISPAWGFLSVYLLSSLPLFHIHGTQPYIDVPLATHIFIAIGMLYLYLHSQLSGYLRISALAGGLMLFVKNEAMLLHLPPLLVLVVSICIMHKNFRVLKPYIISLLLIGLPWLLFKWSHNLAFGNAKEVSGLDVSWQSGVGYAIWINSFFEGNWALLLPLFFGLVITSYKHILQSPLLVLIGFFLMVYLGQLPIYFFTGLSTEAINQTGYARGLIQLMPIAVCSFVVLIHTNLQKDIQ